MKVVLKEEELCEKQRKEVEGPKKRTVSFREYDNKTCTSNLYSKTSVDVLSYSPPLLYGYLLGP